MRYDVILMDIDNTLLDFHAGTKEALIGLLADFGLELTAERETRFHEINNRLWTAYEHGEIPKSSIFELRFAEFLGEMGIETDPLEANDTYARGLQQSAVLADGSLLAVPAEDADCHGLRPRNDRRKGR